MRINPHVMRNADILECVRDYVCVCVYLQRLLRHGEFSFYNREQVGMWDRQVKEIKATVIHKHTFNVHILVTLMWYFSAAQRITDRLHTVTFLVDVNVASVKGYHIQTLACLPALEWCTSAPGYEHHSQMSAESAKPAGYYLVLAWNSLLSLK